MARIRTIKPEFYGDEKIASLPRDARLLFIGLWNFADDYGVVKGNPLWLKSSIFPYDDISSEIFKGWLNLLTEKDFIRPFTANQENYFYIKNFKEHQVVNRPSGTRNPEPHHDVISEDYMNTHGVLKKKRCRKGREMEGKGGEGDGAEPEGSRAATPPAITIPLNDNSEFPITQKQIEEWQKLYPAVNVAQTLNRIRSWNINNAKKRKTKNGVLKHIDTWLAGEQDQGGKPPPDRVSNRANPSGLTPLGGIYEPQKAEEQDIGELKRIG